MSLFANLRPALLYPELAAASTLKPEIVAGLDLMIVRELTGDIYFGAPRGRRKNAAGDDEGFDTMHYSAPEVARIARVGFETARKRGKKLCSVDKANVLDTSVLWREIVSATAKEYPDVALTHMYVDNAAMQLVRSPKQFDVIVTGNLFGDILSDEASMLAGSIGMLPSASLDAYGKGLYEPIHGSAPDIAGQDKANPLATILSVAMMFRYTFERADIADRIETAVRAVLAAGIAHRRHRAARRPGDRNPRHGRCRCCRIRARDVSRVTIPPMHDVFAGLSSQVLLRCSRRGNRHARRQQRPRNENHDDQDDLTRRLGPAVASASGSGGGRNAAATDDQGGRNASRIRRLAGNGRFGAHAAHDRRARFRSHRSGVLLGVEGRRQGSLDRQAKSLLSAAPPTSPR